MILKNSRWECCRCCKRLPAATDLWFPTQRSTGILFCNRLFCWRPVSWPRGVCCPRSLVVLSSRSRNIWKNKGEQSLELLCKKKKYCVIGFFYALNFLTCRGSWKRSRCWPEVSERCRKVWRHCGPARRSSAWWNRVMACH